MFIFKYNNRVDNLKNIEYNKPVIRDILVMKKKEK